MRNAWLEETQAGIKIAGRNANNLRYADDIAVVVESEEELKNLLMLFWNLGLFISFSWNKCFSWFKKHVSLGYINK